MARLLATKRPPRTINAMGCLLVYGASLARRPGVWMLAGRELITRLTGGQGSEGHWYRMNLTGHHLVTCPWTVFCSERCKQRAGEAGQ